MRSMPANRPLPLRGWNLAPSTLSLALGELISENLSGFCNESRQ